MRLRIQPTALLPAVLKRRGKNWSRRPGLNGRPAVYEIPRISTQTA